MTERLSIYVHVRLYCSTVQYLEGKIRVLSLTDCLVQRRLPPITLAMAKRYMPFWSLLENFPLGPIQKTYKCCTPLEGIEIKSTLKRILCHDFRYYPLRLHSAA